MPASSDDTSKRKTGNTTMKSLKDSEHLMLSKQLAKALGFRPRQIKENNGFLMVMKWPALKAPKSMVEGLNSSLWFRQWVIFDYRDWSIVSPLAEAKNCFPIKVSELWTVSLLSESITGYTPQEAIARAFLNLDGAMNDKPVAYYMRDNHTFRKLSPDLLAALQEIEEDFDAGWTHGMLNSKHPSSKDLGVVHANGPKEKSKFLANCKEWLMKLYGTKK
jgi:hypothetical protein